MPFNEESLRREIVSVWGEYGAHAEVFDAILKRLDASREVADVALTLEDSGCGADCGSYMHGNCTGGTCDWCEAIAAYRKVKLGS